jgi:MoaD family protein
LTIKLNLRSHLKAIIGKQQITVNLNDPCTIKDLVHELIKLYGEDVKAAIYDVKRDAIKVLPIVNHRKSLQETQLKDEDEVILLPPIAGG